MQTLRKEIGLGQIARVRQRTYLVDGVVPPKTRAEAEDLKEVPQRVALPEEVASLEVILPQDYETLQPTHAVPIFKPKEDEIPWQMFIQVLPSGMQFDKPSEADSSRHWQKVGEEAVELVIEAKDRNEYAFKEERPTCSSIFWFCFAKRTRACGKSMALFVSDSGKEIEVDFDKFQTEHGVIRSSTILSICNFQL